MLERFGPSTQPRWLPDLIVDGARRSRHLWTASNLDHEPKSTRASTEIHDQHRKSRPAPTREQPVNLGTRAIDLDQAVAKPRLRAST